MRYSALLIANCLVLASLTSCAKQQSISATSSAITSHTQDDSRKNNTEASSDAIEECTKAIELNPQNADAYGKRAIARGRKGDLDGAITDFNKAIELDPQYMPGYFGRGHIRGQKGDLDGAIADYTKAIELKQYAEPYCSRGLVLVQ